MLSTSQGGMERCQETEGKDSALRTGNGRESRTEWTAGGMGSPLTGVQRREVSEKGMLSEDFLEEGSLEQKVQRGLRAREGGKEEGKGDGRSVTVIRNKVGSKTRK